MFNSISDFKDGLRRVFLFVKEGDAKQAALKAKLDESNSQLAAANQQIIDLSKQVADLVTAGDAATLKARMESVSSTIAELSGYVAQLSEEFNVTPFADGLLAAIGAAPEIPYTPPAVVGTPEPTPAVAVDIGVEALIEAVPSY